jgi:hypothetical protein
MQDFGGKHEGSRVLGRPRSKWKKNIKIVLQNVERGVNWISLAQVARSCSCGNELSGYIKCG